MCGNSVEIFIIKLPVLFIFLIVVSVCFIFLMIIIVVYKVALGSDKTLFQIEPRILKIYIVWNIMVQ